MDFYQLFKDIAFKFDPEKVHDYTIHLLRVYPSLAGLFTLPHGTSFKPYELNIAGMTWSFPVGLAAGLDKNARAIKFFERLAFGAIEVGTVTPKAQKGNAKPRMWRLEDDSSLRNSMGFNNRGADYVYKKLLRSNFKKNIGVNLGKNKNTSDDKALDDYVSLFKKFDEVSDYLVVNLSSPNTPGLRNLQNEGFIVELLNEYKKINSATPLFIKLSPDMHEDEYVSLVRVIMNEGANGIIATNTSSMPDLGTGGISGNLIAEKAEKVRKIILRETADNPQFEVIGVGGISSADQIFQFWRDGGKVVQIYSSLIYHGPKILLTIKNEIDRVMKQHQFDNLSELISNIKEI